MLRVCEFVQRGREGGERREGEEGEERTYALEGIPCAAATALAAGGIADVTVQEVGVDALGARNHVLYRLVGVDALANVGKGANGVGVDLAHARGAREGVLGARARHLVVVDGGGRQARQGHVVDQARRVLAGVLVEGGVASGGVRVGAAAGAVAPNILAQVPSPTIPSAVKPLAACHSFTLASVPGPNAPSAAKPNFV